MGLFTTVEHPAAGEIQFKHGDDFQCHARLGESFVGYESGMPPDGLYLGISGAKFRCWIVAVKDNIAVAAVRAVAVEGTAALDAQVKALEAEYGLRWQE